MTIPTPNDPCSRWLEAISGYLDGELPPIEEQQVHAHLRTCAACAEALVDLVPVVQALRNAPMATPTRDLWPALAGELRRDPRFWVQRPITELPRRLGLVAAGLMALVGGVAVFSHLGAPPKQLADVDTYWHEHALYSQEEALPGSYAPGMHAVDASYELDR